MGMRWRYRWFGTTTLSAVELTNAKADGLKILPPENYFGDLTGIGITITSQDFSGDYVDTATSYNNKSRPVSEILL